MKQDNELKNVFLKFSCHKKETNKLDTKSYLKLVENILNIYEKLISEEKCFYTKLLEDMLSFELYQYILLFENGNLYNKYRNQFFNYSINDYVITQEDILECVSLGITFFNEEENDYFYDYESDSHIIFYDEFFMDKGSKNKQYYLIQRSN